MTWTVPNKELEAVMGAWTCLQESFGRPKVSSIRMKRKINSAEEYFSSVKGFLRRRGVSVLLYQLYLLSHGPVISKGLQTINFQEFCEAEELSAIPLKLMCPGRKIKHNSAFLQSTVCFCELVACWILLSWRSRKKQKWAAIHGHACVGLERL